MCLDRLYKYKNNNKPESILKLCLCCCALQTFFSLPCCILSYITYFAILAFHLKEIIVTESLQIAYRSPFICHSHIYCCQHIAPCVLYSRIFSLCLCLSVCANCHFADWLWEPSPTGVSFGEGRHICCCYRCVYGS